MRPEHGSADHFGYGTLTFTLSGTSSPYPSSPIPEAPEPVTATASVGRVYLKWKPVRTANGYDVLRASNGDSYTSIARLTQTTWPEYTDTSVTNGTTYSYKVEAINQSGTSVESRAVSATPLDAGALPSGWQDTDIGTVKTIGNAAYAKVGNGTTLVTGQGSGIGGASDSFNFAYRQVTGDFTLTTRLTNVDGKALNSTGLMMRESLDSDAPVVAMLLGSTGWRIAEMGTRSLSGGSMRWVTGDQYTWMPVWFRLRRSGNVFTGYQSADGVTWFAVGTSTVPMAGTYYVGLAASSGDTKNNTVETSAFDNTGSACRIPDRPHPDRDELPPINFQQSCTFPDKDRESGEEERGKRDFIVSTR